MIGVGEGLVKAMPKLKKKTNGWGGVRLVGVWCSEEGGVSFSSFLPQRLQLLRLVDQSGGGTLLNLQSCLFNTQVPPHRRTSQWWPLTKTRTVPTLSVGPLIILTTPSSLPSMSSTKTFLIVATLLFTHIISYIHYICAHITCIIIIGIDLR